METHRTTLMINVLLIFLSSSLFFHSQAISPAGTIERVTRQQILTSLPPNNEPTPTGSSHLFLTSPSGKYGAFLIRRETSIGAGGFGSDFCYIQVQHSGVSVWESECAPVSNVNTCTLMFSDAGLEIFDGSNSAWDGDVDGEDLEILELLDVGDMRIRDKEGELVWRASDNPIANQNCGSIGAPGQAPALPPFASPIHGDDEQGPFGQPAPDTTTPQIVNNVNPGLPAAAVATPGVVVDEQAVNPALPATAPGVAADEEVNPALPAPATAPSVATDEEVNPGLTAPAVAPGVAADEDVNPELPTTAAAAPGTDEEQQQQELGHPKQGSSSHHPLAAGLNQPGYSNSLNQPFGGGAAQHANQEPLIDNNPFDSGCSREKAFNFGVALVITVLGLVF